MVTNPALEWNPFDMVVEMEDGIRQQSLDNLEPEHIQVSTSSRSPS